VARSGTTNDSGGDVGDKILKKQKKNLIVTRTKQRNQNNIDLLKTFVYRHVNQVVRASAPLVDRPGFDPLGASDQKL